MRFVVGVYYVFHDMVQYIASLLKSLFARFSVKVLFAVREKNFEAGIDPSNPWEICERFLPFQKSTPLSSCGWYHPRISGTLNGTLDSTPVKATQRNKVLLVAQ